MTIPPIFLNVRSKTAYSSLVNYITMLIEQGVEIPCILNPLYWDVESYKEHDCVTDRNYRKRIANYARRKCNDCQALTVCEAYKETVTIRSGVLAGEWFGSHSRKKH